MKTHTSSPRLPRPCTTATLLLVVSLGFTACEIDLREGKYEGTVSGTKTDANGTTQISNGGASMIIELTNDMPGNRADSYVFRLCEDLLPKKGTEGCGNGYNVDVDDNAFSQYFEYWVEYDYLVNNNGYDYWDYCYYTETINLIGSFTNDHQITFSLLYSSKDETQGCRDLAGVPHAMDVEGIVTMN